MNCDAPMSRIICSFLVLCVDGTRLGTDGQDFFTSYDEVCESFDAMGLQENLLRGIYAYGMFINILIYNNFKSCLRNLISIG